MYIFIYFHSMFSNNMLAFMVHNGTTVETRKIIISSSSNMKKEFVNILLPRALHGPSSSVPL
jgi:hypothetical protein